MDHDHGMHGGHGDSPMCSMNMLFTWDTTNLCIIFPRWRIDGTGSLIGSLIAIVALTAGYELVRELSRRYELRVTQPIALDRDSSMGGFLAGTYSCACIGDEDHERSSLLRPGRFGKDASGSRPEHKTIRGIFYAVQIFYSFFIMLLFMTYNGWVMLAVTVGAFVGFMLFSGNAPATKTVACH